MLTLPLRDTFLADIVVANAVDVLALGEHTLESALGEMSLSHSWDSNREDHNDLCLLSRLSISCLLLLRVFIHLEFLQDFILTNISDITLFLFFSRLLFVGFWHG